MRHSGLAALFILLLTLAPAVLADDATSDDSFAIAGWFQDLGEVLGDFWKSLTTPEGDGSGDFYQTENTNDLGGGNNPPDDDMGPYSDPTGVRER